MIFFLNMKLMSLFSIADVICGRNNPFCTSSKGAAGDFDEKEQKSRRRGTYSYTITERILINQ